MTTYSSPSVTLPASADKVYEKLSNIENLKELLNRVPADKIPEDKRQMYDNLKITSDSIEIPGGPMGNLIFRVTEKVAPSLIRLTGEGMPIAMAIEMHISPISDTSSSAKIDFNLDIPALLKPMIGGQIQKMANQFGEVLGAIPF